LGQITRAMAHQTREAGKKFLSLLKQQLSAEQYAEFQALVKAKTSGELEQKNFSNSVWNLLEPLGGDYLQHFLSFLNDADRVHKSLDLRKASSSCTPGC
jgi:hypothetical protein